MTTKRTIPTLLVAVSLVGLFTTGCFFPPYHRHHRRLSLDLNVGTAPAVQAEAAGR
ncbi:MAG TPA: hypothetical protein VGS07_06425 [Thermoanaerobaculia bacterium]|jgi:hypothetical protein|nr:hypothetical protein [Thermoanaerobaculia bacterium]